MPGAEWGRVCLSRAQWGHGCAVRAGSHMRGCLMCPGPGPPQIAEKLIKTFAEQIFYTGFIHSDPHPGNGRKRPSGQGWGQGRGQRA